MFDRKKQTPNQTTLKKVNRTPSIISEDMRLTGSLVSQGEVQIDGMVDGDVKAENLVVGTTGIVEGKVDATNLVVKGKIEGSLNASKIHIQSTAHVHGDVFHDSISVDSGAVIEGSLKQRVEEDEIISTTSDSTINSRHSDTDTLYSGQLVPE